MADDIRDSLAFVLDNYQQTRQQVTNPRKDLPVCSRLLILKGLIDRACAENGFANLVVYASWGKGAWNPNPWIALLDPRITETTRNLAGNLDSPQTVVFITSIIDEIAGVST